MSDPTHRIGLPAAMSAAVLGLVISVFSQTTVSTGGIQGTVTDASGALVSGAKVSLTNVATGQMDSANTNSAGAYTFAFLRPGDFVVRVEAKDFKTRRLPLTVKVGQTVNGNAKLVVGDSSDIIAAGGLQQDVQSGPGCVAGKSAEGGYAPAKMCRPCTRLMTPAD